MLPIDNEDSINIALTTLGELFMVFFEIFSIMLLVTFDHVNITKLLAFDTIAKGNFMFLPSTLYRIIVAVYPYSRLIHYIIFNLFEFFRWIKSLALMVLSELRPKKRCKRYYNNILPRWSMSTTKPKI